MSWGQKSSAAGDGRRPVDPPVPGNRRFLEIAALANGQVTSVASISRDAGVARPTVQRYFDVLVDTLIGLWVRPWKASARVKEVGHPKFYFFDTGVVRALRGATREPVERAERGSLLETLVLHELRAYMAIAGTGGEITYWGTPSGAEIDFIWRRGKRTVGIEVKVSNRYRSEEAATLREFPPAQTLRFRVRRVRRPGRLAGRERHGPSRRGVHATARSRRRDRVVVRPRVPGHFDSAARSGCAPPPSILVLADFLDRHEHRPVRPLESS